MVFLGLEKPVEYGAQQIFDPTMANMVLQAQQQYNEAARKEYERGLEDFDKFTTKYGDFISPFAKDMARYGEMVGGIQNVINQAYADGVDLLRSPEGRMLVHKLTNSINPAEFNMMRSNAKLGYDYLDAIQKLRSKGKYSEAQELFDIMQSGGLGVDSEGNPITDFSQFSTAGKGGLNAFNRSPIEATTLQDLTKSHYVGRQARVLNQQDFNDPRLKGKGYNWDPNYEWTGYLRSDLLKNAPGAILSLAADPRFAFFREQAKQAVMARGEDPTDEAVNRQLMEDVADANTWALIDPTRDENKFALQRQQHGYAVALENLKHANDMELQGLKNRGGNSSSSSSGGGIDYEQILGLGVDTALATESSLWHSSQRKKFIEEEMKKNSDYNASRTRFGKMLKRDQEIGRQYMKDLETQSDPSASAEEKRAAAERIRNARGKKDANFVAWRTGYDKLISSAEDKWDKENTLSGATGNKGKASISDLYKAATDIYSRLHEVDQASPLASQLNQHLDYHVDKDGNTYSYMNKNKKLDVVALSNLLGGKFRTEDHEVIKKIQNAIKGKMYYEDSDNLNRTFGSGTYHGRTVNTAREVAIFKDKNLFDNLTSDEKKILEYIGITKSGDEWRVPITTITNQGYSWAYEDAMTNKEVGGTSLASQGWPDQQATQFTGIYNWQ